MQSARNSPLAVPFDSMRIVKDGEYLKIEFWFQGKWLMTTPYKVHEGQTLHLENFFVGAVLVKTEN